jgi:hypothetical protein
MSDSVHTSLSWKITVIARALEANGVPVKGVAFMATKDEWESMLKEIQETSFYPINLYESSEFTYRGIVIIKPKS